MPPPDNWINQCLGKQNVNNDRPEKVRHRTTQPHASDYISNQPTKTSQKMGDTVQHSDYASDQISIQFNIHQLRIFGVNWKTYGQTYVKTRV